MIMGTDNMQQNTKLQVKIRSEIYNFERETECVFIQVTVNGGCNNGREINTKLVKGRKYTRLVTNLWTQNKKEI